MEFINELPANVLKNILSFRLGKPEYVKIKHSETLRRIQNKYKITTTEEEYTAYKLRLRTNNNNTYTKTEYSVIRDRPFKIENLKWILRKQEKTLLSLIYEELEDEQNFSARLVVIADVVARDNPNKNFEDGEFEYHKAISHVDEFNEDNSFPALQDIEEELMDEIKDYQAQYNVIGIRAFRFKLRISEWMVQ